MRRSVVVLLACVACGDGSQSRRGAVHDRPRIEQVRAADVTDRVLLSGTLQAVQSVELRVPRTSAWELSIRWMADDGVAVKQGDRVLEFDTSAFMQNIAERRLQYLDAAMSFRTAQDLSGLELAQKRFELETQRIVLAKAKVLSNVPADLLAARTAQERQLELKRAETGVATAEKTLASAQAAASLDMQVKRIELDKARTSIEDTERSIAELALTAPRDGTILVGDHPWMGRKLQVGDSTQPGWTIVSLPDHTSGMEVRAELSDVDDGRVSVGMTGTCMLDAFPGEQLPCAVKTLMPVASAKGPKSLRRGFSVLLSIASPGSAGARSTPGGSAESIASPGSAGARSTPGGSAESIDKVDPERMRPGMAIKVDLRRAPLAAVPAVSRGAVRFAGNKVLVRLADGELREVELGACDAQRCAVVKGLVAGDRVLLGGPS